MGLNTTKTVVVSARVDARSLATIAIAFADKKILVKSRSHLNSLIIETFCDSLVERSVVTRIKTTEEAVEILLGLNVGFEESLRRKVSALASQINSENAIEGISENLQGAPVVTKSKVDEALKVMKESEEE